MHFRNEPIDKVDSVGEWPHFLHILRLEPESLRKVDLELTSNVVCDEYAAEIFCCTQRRFDGKCRTQCPCHCVVCQGKSVTGVRDVEAGDSSISPYLSPLNKSTIDRKRLWRPHSTPITPVITHPLNLSLFCISTALNDEHDDFFCVGQTTARYQIMTRTSSAVLPYLSMYG